MERISKAVESEGKKASSELICKEKKGRKSVQQLNDHKKSKTDTTTWRGLALKLQPTKAKKSERRGGKVNKKNSYRQGLKKEANKQEK